MSTVQSVFGRFLNVADPIVKGTSATFAGQKFKVASEGIAITSVATDSGVVKITAANHGLSDNMRVTIYGATGDYAASVNNTLANPTWTVSDSVTNSFNLTGSTYAGAVTTGTIVPAMAGSVDGARFNRSRQLDIYNEARIVLFNVLRETKDPKDFGRCVSGTFTSATITFSASGSYVVATKPTGYIELVSMIDASSVPIYVIEDKRMEELRGGNPDFVVSASNLYAFETGTQFKIPSASLGAGAGTIDYYGITAWTWFTDIFPNTTVELFSPDLEPILIEIACAIADEQGNANVNALAKMLLNKKE
jgi:hypothetical protein